jgi:hypothetical protein
MTPIVVPQWNAGQSFHAVLVHQSGIGGPVASDMPCTLAEDHESVRVRTVKYVPASRPSSCSSTSPSRQRSATSDATEAACCRERPAGNRA